MCIGRNTNSRWERYVKLKCNTFMRECYLSKRPWSDTIHGARFKVHQYCSRNVLPTSDFVKVDVDALQLQVGIAMVCSCRINPMLVRNNFPELCAYLGIKKNMMRWFLCLFKSFLFSLNAVTKRREDMPGRSKANLNPGAKRPLICRFSPSARVQSVVTIPNRRRPVSTEH